MRRAQPDRQHGFYLSRSLESGKISFEDLKALAGRLMDRACVRRAERLREQIGYVDNQATIREFSNFVAKTVGNEPDADKAFADFKQRWGRARNGIVFTAHPTFGLSEALSRRMVEIASGEVKGEPVIGLPHRPDANITLDYEHKAVQVCIHNLRDAFEELLNGFYSGRRRGFGERAYKFRPKIATIASWVGYDLDGRTDIKWTHSFVLKLAGEGCGPPRRPHALHHYQASPARRRGSAAHRPPDRRQARSRHRFGPEAARCAERGRQRQE